MWEIRDDQLVVTVRHIRMTLDVCSDATPRQGAYAVQRIDDETWRVMPVIYMQRGALWVSIPTMFDQQLIPESILLTNAPTEASAWLASK